MDAEARKAVKGTEVQAADEGASGEAGAGGRPDDPEGLGFPSVQEGQGGPSSLCGPSGTAGPDNEDGPCSLNGQGDNTRGCPGVLGGPGVQGAAVSATVDAPSPEGAVGASRPRGDAGAGGPGSPQISLILSLPFQSYLQAEIAHTAMEARAQRHWQDFQMVATVNGRTLTVSWIGEDVHLFRRSVNSYLRRLSWVLQSIQQYQSYFPSTTGN